MSTAERTYSFRAPEELRSRVERALASWIEEHAELPSSSDELSRRFVLELHRRRDELERHRESQSALFRLIAEAFAAAAEKARAAQAATADLQAWAREDTDGRAVRAAALRAAAERWRDD